MVNAKKFNIDEEAAILLGGPANKKMTREGAEMTKSLVST
jgi:hypothetical protein